MDFEAFRFPCLGTVATASRHISSRLILAPDRTSDGTRMCYNIVYDATATDDFIDIPL